MMGGLGITDETQVLCSVVKWCWSRLPGGVVGWEAYELFRVGETGMLEHLSRASQLIDVCRLEYGSRLICNFYTP